MSSHHPGKPKDPLVEAQIERTLRKFAAVSTPAMLETMREELEELLTTHPVAAGLLEQRREHAPPATGHSGEGAREGVAPDEDAAGATAKKK
jgi:hypothetical protein